MKRHSEGDKKGFLNCADEVKSVILCSHLGQPNEEKTEKFHIAPVARVVRESLAGLCST